jgi:FixJ family two-component response regulator
MKIERIANLLAVLVDDKSVQSALQDPIESAGMSTLCFDSAEQFLHSEARHKAACVIADIRVQGMSGLELLAKLKIERCRIPIIFITGRGDIPSAVYAMKEDASDFLLSRLMELHYLVRWNGLCSRISPIAERLAKRPA